MIKWWWFCARVVCLCGDVVVWWYGGVVPWCCGGVFCVWSLVLCQCGVFMW